MPIYNGQEALEVLSKRGDIDLVLMDVQMPEMDGLTTTRIIRGMEHRKGVTIINPHVPVVAITANAMREDIALCLSAGMNDYLSKPIKSKELLWIINKNVKKQNANLGRMPSMEKNTTNKITPSEPLIDREKALELLGGDEEMLEQILDMFVGYVPNQVKELQIAFEQRDLERLHRISHSLKSNAGTIGCEELRAVAYQMELSAKGQDLEGFQRHFDDYRVLLDKVLSEIKAMKT